MVKKQKATLLAIAKDALSVLSLVKISPGKWCDMTLPNVSGDDQLQKYIGNKDLKKRKCEVCADGLLFLSAVRLYNEFPVAGYLDENIKKYEVNDNDLFDVLNEKIGCNQAALIECTFELGQGKCQPDDIEPEWLGHLAIEYGKQYKKPVDRMKAILKNIIRNSGEFIPMVLAK